MWNNSLPSLNGSQRLYWAAPVRQECSKYMPPTNCVSICIVMSNRLYSRHKHEVIAPTIYSSMNLRRLQCFWILKFHISCQKIIKTETFKCCIRSSVRSDPARIISSGRETSTKERLVLRLEIQHINKTVYRKQTYDRYALITILGKITIQ